MAFGLQKTKKRVVNRHISHHENTADANYVAAYSAARASQAHTIISGIVNNPYAVAETSTVPSDRETEEDQEEVPRFQPQRGLSDEVKVMIRRRCQGLLEGKAPINSATVKAALEVDPHHALRRLLHSHILKKVVDFVRHHASVNLPEEEKDTKRKIQ